MTPKEKAQYLIEYSIKLLQRNNQIKADPKEMALNRVETMLYLTEVHPEVYEENNDYWKQVKQEIEKL